MKKSVFLITIAVLIPFFFILASGCSGGGMDPVAVTSPDKTSLTEGNHASWGLWQFTADPVAGTLDIVPLRNAGMHLNALPFLEPPPFLNLTLESVEFNGNIIDVDIGLRHPFLGLTQFTGFDVCGILITNGSVTGFSDSDLLMAGEGDTRLLNPDGYSRWWNPAEFPVNNGTMFSYTDGLLGSPDSYADYNCTLNAYKYFADGLETDDPVSSLGAACDGVFSAGQKNIRHYTLELGDEGLIFNYAVDANWAFPSGAPPYQAPGDFPPQARCPEAWNISITEVDNTLWNDGVASGGKLSLIIDVWDHFYADLNTVKIESPGNFAPAESSTPTGSGEGYSTYEIDITNAAPVSAGTIDLLITVACEKEGYQDLLSGKIVSKYFTSTAAVMDESPGPNYHLEWDSEATINSNSPSWNDISPALAVETDNQTVVAWNCDRPDSSSSTRHYQNYSRSSDGISWPNGTNCFPGGSHKGDFVKCAASTNGTSFSTFATVYSSGNPPFNPFGTRNENYAFGANYCFPRHDLWSSIEMFVSQTGRVFVFTDYNYYSSTAGIIDTQHSNGPNTLDGGVSWWGYPSYSVTTDGLISHSRSIGDTSDGTMHLLYYALDGSAGMLVSSTDGSTGETWGTPVTVFDDINYSNYFDPSLAIDGDDAFNVTCRCYSTSEGAYKILFAQADGASGPFSDPVVVHTSTSEMEQPALDVMEYPGGSAYFISWVEGGTVYLSYSLDGDEFVEPIVVQETYSQSQQADCIVDHIGNLQVVWSRYDATNWEITIRRAMLVED